MIPTYKEFYTFEDFGDFEASSTVYDTAATYLPGGGSLPQVSWAQLAKGRLLGRGVYGCTHQGLLTLQDGETVDEAIKVLHDEDAGGGEVYEEACVLQKVAGAGGAPQLYGVTVEAPPAIVMELCTGEVLRDFLVDQPIMTAVKAYLAAFKALEELHQTGHVHNDIHEGNIMIDTDNEDSSHQTTAQIIDFGSAVYLGDIESDASVDTGELYRLALGVESCMHDIEDDDAGTCREFRATLRRIGLVVNRKE